MNPIKVTPNRDYQQMIRSFLQKEEVQAYTMAILSFFALAFFSVFAIRPTLISFFTLQRQIADAKLINDKLEIKINSLLSAQEEYQKNQASLTLLDSALPSEAKFPELVKRIENIVNDKEATISAFSTKTFSLLEQKSAVTKPQSINSVDFSLILLPDYIKSESVIASLLNLRRLITLSMLELSEKIGDKIITVESKLDASAFYSGSKTTTTQ